MIVGSIVIVLFHMIAVHLHVIVVLILLIKGMRVIIVLTMEGQFNFIIEFHRRDTDRTISLQVSSRIVLIELLLLLLLLVVHLLLLLSLVQLLLLLVEGMLLLLLLKLQLLFLEVKLNLWHRFLDGYYLGFTCCIQRPLGLLLDLNLTLKNSIKLLPLCLESPLVILVWTEGAELRR